MVDANQEAARAEVGQSLDFGGSSTNYHDVGEGPPVLLVHGSGPGVTAWANWRLNIPVLAESFRVIAPDMFGFGYSDSKGRIQDKQVWVDQLASLLDALGIDKISMVGNSFGGGVTLAFMIAHPDRVDRAVLMGPAGLNFPITPALDKVWGYEPSIEAMRESLKYLAWDHSRLTDDLIQSRYEASIRPGMLEPYRETFGGECRHACQSRRGHRQYRARDANSSWNCRSGNTAGLNRASGRPDEASRSSSVLRMWSLGPD